MCCSLLARIDDNYQVAFWQCHFCHFCDMACRMGHASAQRLSKALTDHHPSAVIHRWKTKWHIWPEKCSYVRRKEHKEKSGPAERDLKGLWKLNQGQALWKMKIDQGRQFFSGTPCPLAICVNYMCLPQLLKQYPFSQEGTQQHLYLILVVAIVTKNSLLTIWPMQGNMLGEAALKHWHSIASLP